MFEDITESGLLVDKNERIRRLIGIIASMASFLRFALTIAAIVVPILLNNSGIIKVSWGLMPFIILGLIFAVVVFVSIVKVVSIEILLTWLAHLMARKKN